MGESARRRRLGVPNTHDRNAWILAEKGIFYSSPDEREPPRGKQFNIPVRVGHEVSDMLRIPTLQDIDRVMHFEDEK